MIASPKNFQLPEFATAVEIGDYRGCQEFLKDHPEILREADLDNAYIDKAVALLRSDMRKWKFAVISLVEKYILLRTILSSHREGKFNFLALLLAPDDETVTDFKNKVIELHSICEARANTRGPVTGENLRQQPSYEHSGNDFAKNFNTLEISPRHSTTAASEPRHAIGDRHSGPGRHTDPGRHVAPEYRPPGRPFPPPGRHAPPEDRHAPTEDRWNRHAPSGGRNESAYVQPSAGQPAAVGAMTFSRSTPITEARMPTQHTDFLTDRHRNSSKTPEEQKQIDTLFEHRGASPDDSPDSDKTETGSTVRRIKDRLSRPAYDVRFQRLPPREWKWWKPGRVFAVSTPDVFRHDDETFEDDFSVERGPITPALRLRRWVVVAVRHTSCLAVPIMTYGGRGLSKAGMRQSNIDAHARIYMSNQTPTWLKNEPRSGKRDIKVLPQSEEQVLDPASRISFERTTSIDLDQSILKIGMVAEESLGYLSAYWREEIDRPNVTGRARDRGHGNRR